MKRLLVLLAVATLTVGAAGCSSWFNRGSSCGSSPCGQAAAPAYMAAPGTVTEGTYLPAPG